MTWQMATQAHRDRMSEAWSFISDELTEMQKDLGCPDHFVAEMLDAIQANWQEAA
ncbi:hypothetical protein [Synechococcus sp. ROS8604]|uniref:hypothetical protein n=1 Tax=Synechococcus sp. ROS8604 TaxID=1442557 RepID=UPI00164573F5|nr:hypothetical protein [Synechococcus sp. ROS8604]QNI89553.1 hypothetical protein SynROS8604_02937 [Synechococcus sp. ROS8604]